MNEFDNCTHDDGRYEGPNTSLVRRVRRETFTRAGIVVGNWVVVVDRGKQRECRARGILILSRC